MSKRHLEPHFINLTYGAPEGVPAPEPYSWKKALAVANAVWTARYKGTMRAEMQVRNLQNGTDVGMAYHVGSVKGTVHQLADQILTPAGPGPTAELLAQYPHLQVAPFSLPLQDANAYQLLYLALDLEAKYLWSQIFQDARARGVSRFQRHLIATDWNGLGLRMSMSEVLEADRIPYEVKGLAVGSFSHLETETFDFLDARYLARLIIKQHLNYEYKEGSLKSE